MDKGKETSKNVRNPICKAGFLPSWFSLKRAKQSYDPIYELGEMPNINDLLKAREEMSFKKFPSR